jgi:hypothetical protein
MESSWEAAILRVLRETSEPLHYKRISEEVLSRGYYATDGATPADTVNSRISSSIKHKGDKSPFIRVGRGIFALNPLIATRSPAPHHKPRMASEKPSAVDDEDIETSDSIVHSFGMYWERDQVAWKANPSLLGRQQAQSKEVDFGAQRGIYLLYDHHTPIYVGRSIDRPLGQRLWEHTTDRLKSRWNRFSWFGLLYVTERGSLKERPLSVSLPSLIATLEAVLIESMEPPQNRRRGDDLSAVEYIQATDPLLRERELQSLMNNIQAKFRSGQS